MAKEIKTIKVTTANEAHTIRAYQCFGWTLLNNQEIYVKDSHLQRKFDGLYNVTETTHYVKLTFERDSYKLRNYQELRQLEDEYNKIPMPGKKPRVLSNGFLVVFAILFLILGLLNFFEGVWKGITSLVVYGGILFFVKRLGESKLESWESANRECWAKRERVLEKAEYYLEANKFV